jgi:galactoside O-acetyltransferase
LNGLKIRFDTWQEKRIYVQIGRSGMINANFVFESKKGSIIIGNNVHMGGVTLISRTMINIANDVTMAWGVTIYDHNSHSIYWEDRRADNKQAFEGYFRHNRNCVMNKNRAAVSSHPVRIGDKVWIGFDVTILKGVTIGEGAVIGAKSVVTKDVPPWTVAAGNPARVVKILQPA